MRIVHEDTERLLRHDGLEAARHRRRDRERLHGLAHAHAERVSGRDRGERIVHVEHADERHADEVVFPHRHELEGRACEIHLHIARAELRIAAHAERDHLHVAREPVGKLLAVTVVAVDDRASLFLFLIAKAREERGLRLEVRIHRAMKIEVVLCEVREN